MCLCRAGGTYTIIDRIAAVLALLRNDKGKIAMHHTMTMVKKVVSVAQKNPAQSGGEFITYFVDDIIEVNALVAFGA